MRRLNRTHLGEDHTTDVLSFPGLAGTGPRPTSRRRGVPGDVPHDYLGDIVISHPRAQAQARDAGHSVTAELQLLIVHGVLHLLGHDHDTPRRKKVMWAAQENILRGLEGRPIQKSVQTARR